MDLNHQPGSYSHGVCLEELLELLLGGRVCEIPDVKTTALICTGSRSIGSLGGGRGSTVDFGLIGQGGRSHGVSKCGDVRHLEGWRCLDDEKCRVDCLPKAERDLTGGGARGRSRVASCPRYQLKEKMKLKFFDALDLEEREEEEDGRRRWKGKGEAVWH